MLSRRSLLHRVLPALAASGGRAKSAAAPLRFAALADVQYAERDTAGKRAYRESLAKLESAARLLAEENPAFVIHLGDLVDGGQDNARRILPVFARLPRPQYHVLGNHDFWAPRATVLRRYGMKQPYYSFRQAGWRFLALDGMYVSVKGGWPQNSPQAAEGAKMLAALKDRRAPNAQDWNGALGEEQRQWLRRTLQDAARRGERAIVFCHFPALAAATTPPHLLWDHAETLSVIDSQPAVGAWFCGHDHAGGRAEDNGVHHFTLPGVVEHELADCVQIVELYPDRIELRTPGAKHGQAFVLR